MKYIGSKRRIAKDILNVMLKDKKHDCFIDIMVGGGNLLESLIFNYGNMFNNIIANDNNHYIIEMYKALKNGWTPPELITEEMYNDIKNNYKINNNYPDYLVCYVGYALSFGGKWFGGYRRDKRGIDKKENEKTQSYRSFINIIKQSVLFNKSNITFENFDYSSLEIPDDSIIYCDIPYKGTMPYSKDGFDYERFYEWCRQESRYSDIYISEYNMPSDFKEVWCKPSKVTIDGVNGHNKLVTEKLFTL